MLSTTYELVVEDYLLGTSRSMLVRHQYWLRAAKKYRAPDVLAIDPVKCHFYLVEVTANQHPGHLLEKLQDYRNGEKRILAGLKEAFQVNVENTWKVIPWLFIWKTLRAPLAEAIDGFEGVRKTYLHEVLTPVERGADTVKDDWGTTPSARALLTHEEIAWVNRSKKDDPATLIQSPQVIRQK